MKRRFWISVGLLAMFVLWTIVVCTIDVQSIGPRNSSVGLAEINYFVHTLTGVHFALYNITDWLGLIPMGVCLGFGIFGLTQWVKRKSIRKVDGSILALGGVYVVTIAMYALFENLVINYRPILMEGILEASYPSSTTMLTMCVMPTAAMQFSARIKNTALKWCVVVVIIVFTVFMVIARILSGVHWITDIIGGFLLSAGLVLLYDSFCLCRTKLD